MDFILVSNAFEAYQVRRKLARSKIHGVKVGQYEVLIEQLHSLWLLPKPDVSWIETLQRSALRLTDSFWSPSIQVDENNVLSQLDKTLRWILNVVPLGEPIPQIENPTSRTEQYWNELRLLHLDMGELLPPLQQYSLNWLTHADETSLTEVNLTIHANHTEPWQQQVFSKLHSLSGPSPQPTWLAELHPSPHSESLGSALDLISKSLFIDNDSIVPPDGLYCCTSRDELSCVESAAGMLQQAHRNGTAWEDMTVVYPEHSSYELWLSRTFTDYAIPASNLPQQQNVFDWQTALLRDLLTLQADVTPPMALMSVMNNPLMPWANHPLKAKAMLGLIRDGDTIEQIFSSELRLLLETRCDNAASVMAWLNAISTHLVPLNQMGLNQARYIELLEQVDRSFSVHDSADFATQCRSVLRQLTPGTLVFSADKIQRLHSVKMVTFDELDDEPCTHLIVLGFNQGHYSYNQVAEAEKSIFSLPDWQHIAAITQLPFDDAGYQTQRIQTQIRKWFSGPTESLTILATEQEFDGSASNLSESAFDLARCFQATSQIDPQRLFIPITQVNHPLFAVESVKVHENPPAVVNDLKFSQNLLELHKNYQGEPLAESPSSLETLLVSPLAWLLDRQGLTDYSWQIEQVDILLQGKVAHKLFELLKDRQTEPYSDPLFDDLFQQAINKEAPFLHDPLWHMERQQLKQKLQPALRQFVTWLRASGWKIAHAEQRLQGTLWHHPIKGFADAILQNGQSAFIVDYKTSQSDKRLKRLNAGFDIQTYVYRQLYRQLFHQDSTDVSVHSGYFNINDQVMVSDLPLSGAQELTCTVPDVGLDQQSSNAKMSIEQRFAQLKQGIIELNQEHDMKSWDKNGITAYALSDNDIVAKNLKPSEE